MAAWSLSRSTNSLALVRLGQHPRLPVSDYLSDSAQTSALLRDEPHRMATVTQDGVAFYSYERPQHFFEESRRVQMSIDGTQIVAISPTGHHVAIVQTSSAPRRVTLYTIAPGDAVTLLAFEGHRSSVTALAFDEEGQYVASVDATEIVLQSVKDKSYARTIPLGGSDSVGALAVSAGGRYVGAIDGGRARVWEMTSATPTELVDRGAGSLCFSGSGRWLAVVTESETQLWDMSRKTLFNRLPGGYGGCSFSSDERYVAVPEGGATGSSGLDVLRLPDFAHVGSITSSSRVVFLPAPGRVLAIGGVVRVASFDPDSAIRTACAITANGSLSEREWRQYAPGLKYIAACP